MGKNNGVNCKYYGVTPFVTLNKAGWESLALKMTVGRFEGRATIGVQGEIGKAYTIEVSDDLVNWEHFHTFILMEGEQVYLDWDSSDKPKRFYRVSD